jgi:hypothetical protein
MKLNFFANLQSMKPPSAQRSQLTDKQTTRQVVESTDQEQPVEQQDMIQDFEMKEKEDSKVVKPQYEMSKDPRDKQVSQGESEIQRQFQT